MKQQFKLNVSPRATTGRSSSRRLRKANQIPAILYGKHTSPENLSVDGPEFTRLIKAVAGSASLIELQRKDKGTALSFLQEIQRDPITDKFLHVDLQEVKADEKMEIRVRLALVGESFGVKNQSGVLETPTQYVRIRCLPTDLPGFIEVDVTELKVGETIHVGELKKINGVDFLDDKNQPVVSCVEPVQGRSRRDACRHRGCRRPRRCSRCWRRRSRCRWQSRRCSCGRRQGCRSRCGRQARRPGCRREAGRSGQEVSFPLRPAA
jgi:large subunit ribosomal protein L25